MRKVSNGKRQGNAWTSLIVDLNVVTFTEDHTDSVVVEHASQLGCLALERGHLDS